MYKFSIIISLYNQRENLESIVKAFKGQSFKDFEVHFCDDHSSDETKEFFKNKPFLGFSYQYHRRKWHIGFQLAKNLNQGIFKAKGEYCVFIMGDSFPHEEYLYILSQYAKPNTVLCGARQQVEKKIDMIVDADYRLKGGLIPNQVALLPVSPFYKTTGNGLCIPTKAIQEIGGWYKIKGYGGDDDLLAAVLFKKGYVFYSLPQAIIYHFHHGFNYQNDKQTKYVKKQIKKLLFVSG